MEAKADIRRAHRARRAARSVVERDAAGAALARHAGALPGSCLAAFVGGRGEPPTVPLLEALRARGTEVLLPLLRADMDLEWAPYRGPEALAEGRRGILEPPGPSLGREGIARAAIVLVPALGIDRGGRRLGQGGGSYDRALGRARGPVVAVIYDEELVDALPAEPHDRPVDAVLLPDGGLVGLRGGTGILPPPAPAPDAPA